jgi:hypothetical protein
MRQPIDTASPGPSPDANARRTNTTEPIVVARKEASPPEHGLA